MAIFLKLLLIGFIILVSAIVANLFTQKLGIVGWYEFLTRLSSEGVLIFKSLRVLDYLWLFLGYPSFLGLAAWLGEKFWQALR